MRATPARVGFLCLGLGLLLFLVLVFGLGMGTVSITPGQVWSWLNGDLTDKTAQVILGQFRLPRLLVAALVGASLSICGAVFQGVLRNPLAEPFILGVSGGAAAGSVLAISLGAVSQWTRSATAFGGAAATVLLIIGIARRRGRMETATLVLTGVMVNAFFTSAIMFIISTTNDSKLHAIMFWLYGDLGGATLEQSFILGPTTIGCGLLIFGFSKHLNILSAGDQAAAVAGVNVERIKLIFFFLVSLLCGVTVSMSGLIGFIGLMTPHLVRIVLGHDHRLLLPAVGLFGASFLILADTMARTIISPAQIPVGVVTAFLGVPFFLMLLAKRGSRWW